MLHITNGDSAGESIGASGLGGAWLAWRDVLHEGPVPAGLELGALSGVRVRYIVDQGWGADLAAMATFYARDSRLAESLTEDEVVLWFEHDLYDQLQLLQLLDWYAEHEVQGPARLSLLCIGDYPGKPDFHGLGELTPEQLAGLFPQRHIVTPAELALGRAGWAAFRSPDPTAIETLLASDTSALPYLADALGRFLEEYPSLANGLGRTDGQLLAAIAAGNETLADIFAASQAMEAAPFMGDTVAWSRLRDLSAGPAPLILRDDGRPIRGPSFSTPPAQFTTQRARLTEDGRALLAGQAGGWPGAVDRWLGGVHLDPADPADASAPRWRRDAAARRLVKG